MLRAGGSLMVGSGRASEPMNLDSHQPLVLIFPLLHLTTPNMSMFTTEASRPISHDTYTKCNAKIDCN